ncbi:hypothetical protein PMSD_14925 [Paenibacillus macquariensis subsp. defensor]|nr:hypothetical protein PMSD_14925 [Paenibacillus macquariensis subsp. defensor]
MNDKLEKYLAKGKEGHKDDIIKVSADGEDWAVRRLTTMEVRRAYELAYEEDGTAKTMFNEIDVMIVKATEHDFDWNDVDLLKSFHCTSKFELPPRLLENPNDYSALSQAVRNFQETKDALIKEAKKSSSKMEKQAG